MTYKHTALSQEVEKHNEIIKALAEQMNFSLMQCGGCGALVDKYWTYYEHQGLCGPCLGNHLKKH